MSLTLRRIVVALLALALLGGAAVWDQRLQHEATARGQQAAAAHAEEDARGVVRALEAPRLELLAEVSRAAAVPILKTLYSNSLGSEGTIQDFVNTEESWASFRERYDSTGLYLGTTLLAGSGTQPTGEAATALRELPPGFPPPASGFVAEGERILLVAAAKIAVATPGGAPGIVALAQQVDAAMLAAAAQKVSGMAGLAAGGALRVAGTPEAKLLLAPALTPGNETRPEVAVGSQPLTPEIRLWVAIDARPFVSEKLSVLQGTRPALYGGAALLAALLAVLLGRGKSAEAAPAIEALSAARAQLEQSQAELQRLSQRIPQLATSVGRPITDPNAVAVESTVQSAQTSRYQNIGLLGEGGMAQVFVAQTKGAEGFRRLFVVKRLKPELTGHSEMVNQFIDEARLGASMVHSNVVPVFDFGRDEEGYYLAQEYILGRDVGALVEASREKLGGPLEPRVVVTLASEALKALGYAHAKQDDAGRPMALVHRDVSPNNLMVSAQGELKLLDFGIVKADNRATQTQAGVVKGNVFFMSPEQARGLPVDQRSDLFSLGMVMFYALTGRTLYTGESNYDLLVRAAEGPRPQDLERLYNVPAPLAEAVKRAIDPVPERRFPTAGDFLAALEQLPAESASGMQALMLTLFRAELEAERERFAGAPT